MDEAKLHEFMGKLVGDMGGAAIMANVILGEELGLYRAMADGSPVTPEQLAERTGCNARLVREWLSGQAATGYVEHDEGRFRLPEEQALALADEDSPVYVAGGAVVLASMYLDKDKLVAAMRGNGACRGATTTRACSPAPSASSGPAIAPTWSDLAAGARRRGARLEQGAKVADVGCGHGASTVIMAQAYPELELHRLRLPRPLDRAGAPARCGCRCQRPRAVHPGGRARLPGRRFRPDLLLRLPARHGRSGRRGPARASGAEADGTVLLVEPFANDELDENLNPVGRMFYAASTFVCTPNSLSQEVGLGLGAQAGERACGTCSRRPASPASAARPRRRSISCSRHASSSVHEQPQEGRFGRAAGFPLQESGGLSHATAAFPSLAAGRAPPKPSAGRGAGPAPAVARQGHRTCRTAPPVATPMPTMRFSAGNAARR